ncbi:MAG TPA: hypothetical protein VN081_02660 [Dongiaceae bacterium]|nr:hypothetical protein [Dongiaceae bacterium]
MNVWCHLPTIIRYRLFWRRVLLIAGLLVSCVALTTTLFLASAPTHAAPGINKTINFQGRLLNSTGGIVPDGNYNIQFKIYQDGDGTQAGDTGGTGGALKWTESYVNNGGTSGVEVKNGFFSVNLGSVNPFGTSVDWNQDTLWLSMNIAGSSSSCTTFGTSPCTADGEMLPMKQIASTPYAMNAGTVGGKTTSQLLQLAQGVQADASTNTSSIFVNKTGTGNLVQLQNTGVDIFTINSSGNITLGNASSQSISVATAGASTDGQQLSVTAGAGGSGTGNAGGTLVLQGGAAGGTNGNGGNVTIDTGAATGAGTAGTVSIGAANAEAVSIGNATTDSTAISLNGTTTANGDINVASPNKSSSFGLTWNGGNTVATLKSTGNTIDIQGGGVNLLTATNNSGQANIGIGNNASSGYALDVTGDVNSSSQYRIGGSTILTNTSLAFGGTTASSISAASGQALTIGSSTGVTIDTNGSASASFNSTNVQIGTNAGTGTPVLFTLDKASSAPSVNSSLLGSMYYDTTLGKLQCYEASGWGSCGASPDNFITLSPQYSNAVMHGSGTGTMTNDFCSSDLNINDGTSSQPTVCGTHEAYNYYDWASSQTSSQSKSIYVTYQLSSSFKNFVAGSTSLMARTDSTDGSVSYQIYKNNSTTGLTACGSSVSASTGAQTSWQKATASGTADPSTCSFAAGDSIVVKITMASANNANAYASTLSFAYKNQ